VELKVGTRRDAKTPPLQQPHLHVELDLFIRFSGARLVAKLLQSRLAFAEHACDLLRQHLHLSGTAQESVWAALEVTGPVGRQQLRTVPVAA
jgi:hypothetical protein